MPAGEFDPLLGPEIEAEAAVANFVAASGELDWQGRLREDRLEVQRMRVQAHAAITRDYPSLDADQVVAAGELLAAERIRREHEEAWPWKSPRLMRVLGALGKITSSVGYRIINREHTED